MTTLTFYIKAKQVRLSFTLEITANRNVENPRVR